VRSAEEETVTRREATRRWWATAADRYELVVSPLVEEELRRGPASRRDAWLELIRPLRMLEATADLGEIVAAYLSNKLLPLNDAVHLASASLHECDYLLTWDLKHLANPNKFGHIQRVSERHDLFLPTIVTPVQLSGSRHGQR
jgi:predicted nucleic acid-binding protein